MRCRLLRERLCVWRLMWPFTVCTEGLGCAVPAAPRAAVCLAADVAVHSVY